ncbi:sigma 54-interacting transcriptional regulator [Usitatibacter palustris]|uniref:Transcriptional regulatory protein QseF n=1 Tax=Usitatibacter palustris TaxID=2732487 RepID=A0A6M4H487_9PROT|nr:sigma 54-interacting transcriptional regulator [Usitatibacter palustris]QJR14411.1 Transcriptional regulatory protein QseF [Usitatibacter palustris]
MSKEGKASLLVVDDDPDLLRLLAIRLKANGYGVSAVDSGQRALASIAASRPELVLTDLRMDGMDGMALFQEIQASYPGLPVIILTAHGTIPDAVAAVKRGVFGYLTKPYDPSELLYQIERALTLHGGSGPRGNGAGQLWREDIITHSSLMEDLLAKAQRVAAGDASVLIQGESGTGKELLARAIHRASPRVNQPFVAINCGAIPETLLESELFGHMKGSFTGAIADQRGLFVAADKGTLFLDEIGDMPLALQVKLLRVIETREVRPIGATRSIPFDVRIISATHRDLAKEKESGGFREDLYYRLNVVTLRLPTLAERPEDIPRLAEHFLATLAPRYGREKAAFSSEALEHLVRAKWPGNVRQLFNVVEQSIALCPTEIIPQAFVEQAIQVEMHEMTSFEDARKRFERDYLTRILKLTKGSVSQAAKLARRNRTEFYKLLQRHGIEAALFKADAK